MGSQAPRPPIGRLAIAVAASLPMAAAAQWTPVERAGLEERLKPDEISIEQADVNLQIAVMWMLSEKGMPYLARADMILRSLELSDDSSNRAVLAARAIHLYRSAYHWKFKREVTRALDCFRKSISMAKRLNGQAVSQRSGLATLYRAAGEPDLAIAEIRTGMAELDSLGIDEGRATLCIDMVGALADKGQLVEAEHWAAKCDTTVPGAWLMLLSERGRIAAMRGDTTGAVRTWQKAVRVGRPPPFDWERIDPWTRMARILLSGRHYPASMAAADSCSAIALRTGDEAGWCTCRILGGHARLGLGRDSEAEAYLRSALDTARHYGYVGLSRVSGDDGSQVGAAAALKDLYLRQGRFDEAVRMTTYWSTLKDTLNSKDGRFEVFRDGMRRSAMADSLEALARQQALQGQLAAERQRRTFLLSASIAGALVLLLVAGLMYKRMQQARRLARQEKQLRESEVDQLLHANEINAITAMLEGQEKERDRVARELHDHMGGMLGAIKLQLAELEEPATDAPEVRSAQYHKVSGLLDRAGAELRRISHDMAASTLSRFGLDKAMGDLCDSLQTTDGIRVELSLHGLEHRLGSNVEITVYRIVQELVSNVLKHAAATELLISVSQGAGRLNVMVSDNGKGFSPIGHGSGSGMGLDNVRARAASLGGTLQVDSTPGHGTTVSVECPLGDAAIPGTPAP